MNTADAIIEPGTDIARLARTRRLVAILAGAVGSGLLLSLAFPPLEIDVVAWFALVPVMLAPTSRRLGVRLAAGALFGFAHSVTNLFWLNEIGFGAGFLLAIYCTLFPAAWYLFAISLRPCPHRDSLDTPPTTRPHLTAPSPIIAADDRGARLVIAPLALAGAWVALEWIQGWLFTGFPWNQLGVTQWRHIRLLQVTRITGIYGLSFVIVAVNVACAHIIAVRIDPVRKSAKRGFPWSVAMAGALLLLAVLPARLASPPPAAGTMLRVVGIQGNIAQCRDYEPAQLSEALAVYRDYTLLASQIPGADLIVWPECAVPAPVLWDKECSEMLADLFATIETPLLIGSLNLETFTTIKGEHDYRLYNSALQFDRDGRLLESYDKIHRVPFGEYVPFSRYLPWLVDWIGMGRDLSPGAEYTLFSLPGGIRTGVNICFEDAFPEISREFTRRGADLLMTITNDAWYAESSGSRQHMTHAVVRAVENARPLFRSGNNSDTCLIMPDGSVKDLLDDPLTGNRFVRGYRSYDIPVAIDAPLTFYTRHGDLFAKICTLAALAILTRNTCRWYRRKQILRKALEPIPGQG